ncbi:MAG: UPF0175 family protein [Blastocatellia bacterium]
MEIAVQLKIPSEQLETANGDAARLVFERFLAEAYRTGQLSHAEIGRILGFQTPMQVDELLKTLGVYNVNYTAEDFAMEEEAIRYMEADSSK